MKKVLFSIMILAVIALTSCTGESAGDVNQDRIYTEYEQFYNSNTGVTTVIARFRFGGALGTLLELDSTDNVKFNGDVLPYNIVKGVTAPFNTLHCLPPSLFSVILIFIYPVRTRVPYE